MPSDRRIKSVNELARYRVGSQVWWVIIRPLKQPPEIPELDSWMLDQHPKTIYSWGPYKELWPKRTVLPKLHHVDFDVIVPLLTSQLCVEQFVICDLVRSPNTGEFFYSNDQNEWIPEEYVFDTVNSANRERRRVLKLVENWVRSHG